MEQPKIYRDAFTVAYYECDGRKHIKLSSVLRRMQQIATDHHDLLGLEYRALYEKHFVFLLSKLGLDILRLPEAGERVEMTTMAKPLRGPRFIRDCIFTDGAGRRLLRAETVWLLADPVVHKIHRPSALPYPIPEVDDGEPVLTPKGRMEFSGQLTPAGSRPVRFSDIDSNHHVNNAVYADICCDFLPPRWLEEMEPRRFYLHFANEAYLGESLAISIAPIPEEQLSSCLPGPISGRQGENCRATPLWGRRRTLPLPPEPVRNFWDLKGRLSARACDEPTPFVLKAGGKERSRDRIRERGSSGPL